MLTKKEKFFKLLINLKEELSKLEEEENKKFFENAILQKKAEIKQIEDLIAKLEKDDE